MERDEARRRERIARIVAIVTLICALCALVAALSWRRDSIAFNTARLVGAQAEEREWRWT